MKKQFYRLRFFFFVLVFFNLIGLIAFLIYPNEIYQKYLLKKEKDVIIQKHNDLGAIGDVYQGQTFKVAFFGSSVLESHGLNFNDKISQKLKQILGQKEVHVDNFSIGWSGINSTLLQIKSLKRLGYHYDIILVSLSLYYQDEPLKQYTFHFSNRWLSENNILAFPSQIKKFFDRHKKDEKLFRSFYKEKSGYHKLLQVLNGKDVVDRELRRHPFIQTRLVDVPIPPQIIKKENRKKIQYHIEQIKQEAGEIADQIYWAPLRMAYHPNFPPDIYTHIWPLWNFQKNNPKFYCSKSLYKIFDFLAENEIDIVKKVGIKVLDYSKFIEEITHDPETPYLDNPKELYLDEFHFSVKGSLLIAKFLAREFQTYMEKNQKSK